MRLIYLSIGWLAVGIAVLGAFLPILPTVPFLLIALWAFGRSSERLHQKLLNDPVFGPDIKRWQERGAIRRPAKILALSAMLGSVLLAALLGVCPPILAVQALVLASVAVFIATRPES
ncbi:YbaN family protein [Paracoccus jeotgali]|uniref:DUF454 domain-containing protein n=1 Tax=Paracoccus jeotgali TaxID=2065379 RepID=A0A2K9MHG8_9RHOB|nr:YbaN family protein [Paracoccus jeotgali]AUM75070.1 DUF454 domain-containing protein [Paracoccus jeotgali]